MKTEFSSVFTGESQDGLKVLEANYLEHILQNSKYNQTKAAVNAGISRAALRYKLKRAFGDKYI